ncbi:tetraspanin-8-like [Parambassis ranga]|uniref:Tetraspanin n=1 Tax=Parambassis ranga TaxID=210632 RepID=A0A6P7HJH2_9TELE|nr:tetraspanin-8-like [Parambassis ranga]
MAINTCLKRTFTIFNIFFAIVGAALILLTLLTQILTNINGGDSLGSRTAILISLYILGGIIMVIAILGAYGAHKESRAALIVFLVCMVIGSLVMLRVAVPIAIARTQLEGSIEEKLRQNLPLDKASSEVKSTIESVQSQLHCCGLFSYNDWEDQIPDSCNCGPDTEESECRTIGYSSLMLLGRKTIYSQPCFPLLMNYFRLGFDIVLGVFFTLAVLALLGLVLTSVMIHQMRYTVRPTVMLTVPAIFSPQPPKYQELHNPPPY